MSKSTLHLFCAGILLGLCGINAWADDSQAIKQCAQQKVAFDGIQPLKYADIIGEANSHIPLLHQHPALCASTDDQQCKGKAYLIPGNTVAVANTCGEYAHVQYIGDKTVSYGWVNQEYLKVTRSERVRKNLMKQSGHTGREPVFELKKGSGIPVCEAYLQRLNSTKFEYPAYCGRPEDDSVFGFVELKRKPFPTSEMHRLIDLYQAITSPIESAGSAEGIKSMNENSGVFTGTLYHRDALPNERFVLASWQYDPWIDPDNNGTPDNVLMWDPDSVEPECGAWMGPTPTQSRIGTVALVMTSDGKTIDQLKTIQIFGHPDGGYYTPEQWVHDFNYPKFMKSFRIIGASYGIFKYRALYYFDTFFDAGADYGDFHDQRKGEKSLEDELGVFLRKDGKTQQICEYQVTE